MTVQHIGKLFVAVALSLVMIGCLGDPPSGTGGDDESPAAQDGSQGASENAGDASDAAAATPLVKGPEFSSTNCEDDTWQSPATGNAHARIKECTIRWGRDTSESPTAFFQTVSFQLRDEETDGVCARATVTGRSGAFSECNAVWIPEKVELTGHHAAITVTLSWGGNDPIPKKRTAPKGF